MLRDFDHNLLFLFYQSILLILSEGHKFIGLSLTYLLTYIILYLHVFSSLQCSRQQIVTNIYITKSANSTTLLVRRLKGIIISQQYCVFYLVELDHAPAFCYKNMFSE